MKNSRVSVYCFILTLLYFFIFSNHIAGQPNQSQNARDTFISNINTAFDEAYVGDFNKAEQLFGDLLKSGLKQFGQRNEDIALLYHKWGVALYLNDDFNGSINQFRNALEIRKAVLESPHIDIGRTYHNLGLNYKYLSQHKLAQDHFLSAISIRKQLENQSHLADSYQELGVVLENIGDYQDAISYYELSLAIYRELYGDADDDVGYLYFLIGSAYELLENKEKAEQNLTSALQTFISTDNTYFQALTQNLLGILEQRLKNDFKQSLVHFKRASDLYRSMDDIPEDIIADLLNNMGIVYRKKGDTQRALFHLDSALTLYKKSYGKNHPKIAGTLDNIGNTYLFREDFTNAIEKYQEALAVFGTNLPIKDSWESPAIAQLSALDSKPVILEVISDKANALMQFGLKNGNLDALESALHNFNIVDSLVNIMRREYSAEGSKLSWITKSRESYGNAIKTALEISKLKNDDAYKDLAFFFAEKSKAVLLLEGFREIEARGFAGIPDEVLKEEKELRLALLNLEKRNYNPTEKSNGPMTAIKDSLLESQRIYRDFVNSLEKDYPKYYKFKYETTVPKIASIQNYLDSKTAIFEYFVDKNHAFAFCITRNDFQIVELHSFLGLGKVVGDFRQAIGDKSFLEDSFQKSLSQYQESGSFLTDHYLNKLLELVPHKEIVRLLIIPDGPLSYVPFEALPLIKDISQKDFFSTKYLISKFIINYSY
ncbi:MAG: tetratricopeptide repeat protein, partial [Bacteroidota bacterium]